MEFIKKDYIQGHKTRVKTFMMMEMTRNKFFDHDGIKVENSNRDMGKSPNI